MTSITYHIDVIVIVDCSACFHSGFLTLSVDVTLVEENNVG